MEPSSKHLTLAVCQIPPPLVSNVTVAIMTNIKCRLSIKPKWRWQTPFELFRTVIVSMFYSRRDRTKFFQCVRPSCNVNHYYQRAAISANLSASLAKVALAWFTASATSAINFYGISQPGEAAVACTHLVVGAQLQQMTNSHRRHFSRHQLQKQRVSAFLRNASPAHLYVVTFAVFGDSVEVGETVQ